MLTMEDKLKKIEAGTIVTTPGFKATGIHTGMKRKRNDLGAIYSEVPANVAGVYTTNVIQAAPLHVTKESIEKEKKLQAIIVNSGNANACTGEHGLKDAQTMRDVTAEKFSIPSHYVGVMSTGVIGLNMPMDKIVPNIEKLTPTSETTDAAAFNESILTTDSCKKSTCYQTTIAGKVVTMAGSAKGSGMIEPNMATMLSFITTDVQIESAMLETALKEVTNKTFNCITVDGDTSTNDTVLVMANGLAKNDALTPNHEDWPLFLTLLQKTCEDLAKMIARDGEGATKLIEVSVEGAADDTQAIQVAKSVVGSSLVKTAVYGTDANWGRIIAAIGYSGADVNPDTIDIALGPIQMLKNSEPLTFSEEEATAYLENDDVQILIDLNNGDGIGKGWGCDLTYDYVRINASYRS